MLLLKILLISTSIVFAKIIPNIEEDIKINTGLELLILHNNDMHARFEQTSRMSGVCSPVEKDAGKCYGGFARVAHVVKEARAVAANGSGPPVLFLNAGDTYTGSPWFTIFKWKIAADCINALKPNATCLGNHEFDENINGLIPFLENLTSPVVSANILTDRIPELHSQQNLKKSVVIRINGVKVGVIGYLTEETKYAGYKLDIDFLDEVIAVREEAKKLKAQGVNILIALGHSGFAKDLDVARDVEDIDLVIGGHTNTFLWNGTAPDLENIEGSYPYIIKQKSGRIVPVVQAYAYTKYMGMLLIKFDGDGEIISYKGNPILLDSGIPEDPEMLQIIDQYRAAVKNVSDVVVGRTSVILDGNSCRLQECNMGNLITDSMVFQIALKYMGEGWTDSPVGIISGGSIRASVSTKGTNGNITRGDVLSVLPFGSYIAAVTMNGTVFLKALEHSVAKYNVTRKPGEFLQYSGVRLTYDMSQPPGSRVVSAHVRCSMCDIPHYEELNALKEYKVLMPSYLATGGDGFSMFEKQLLEIYDYGDVDCLVDYLQRESPVFPEVNGRLVLLNGTKNN